MRKPRIQAPGVAKVIKSPQIRFKGGALLMLSRKTTVSGKIPYFMFGLGGINTPEQKEAENTNSEIDISLIFPLDAPAQHALERGIPILVFETPILVKRDFSQKFKDYRYSRSHLQKPGKFWQVKFVLNERLCIMFLTAKQYNHELVKAVPAIFPKTASRPCTQPVFTPPQPVLRAHGFISNS